MTTERLPITLEQIQEYSDRIAAEFKPERIILFGSYAYGTPTADSDVDLLVVMRFEEDSARKATEIRQVVRAGFPVDLLVRPQPKLSSGLNGTIGSCARSSKRERSFMQPLTTEWIAKAEGDFVSATREMRARKAPNYDAACFHAQQCAEKYMKARLQEANISFPRTHDLEVLLDLLLRIEPGWSTLRQPRNC